jgi:hypothetical protein
MILSAGSGRCGFSSSDRYVTAAPVSILSAGNLAIIEENQIKKVEGGQK